MHVQLITVPILTSSGGAFSVSMPVQAGGGRLLQYRYVPHGSVPLDTGADLDIVGSRTGMVYANQDDIGTAAFTKAPRQPTHDASGAASLYAATGEPVEDFIYVGGEPLTITISGGGNAKQGTLYLFVG